MSITPTPDSPQTHPRPTPDPRPSLESPAGHEESRQLCSADTPHQTPTHPLGPWPSPAGAAGVPEAKDIPQPSSLSLIPALPTQG